MLVSYCRLARSIWPLNHSIPTLALAILWRPPSRCTFPMALGFSFTTAPGSLVSSVPSARAFSSTSRISLAMKASFNIPMDNFRSAASTRSRIGNSSDLFQIWFSSWIRQ